MQGTLGLGKEYTINTYVGHVFFFTDMKDKTKEYGRFVMKADQVSLADRNRMLTCCVYCVVSVVVLIS